MDLLREAATRKWFLALGAGVTLLLAALSVSLKMDVVDGALAATRLFGRDLGGDIQSVDVALRPLLQAVAYATFYGGLVFGIVACSDFGPSLLTPGRIEHLLALPIRRWELFLGTFVGILILAMLAALYGAGGLCLILGVKTGIWTLGPLFAALLASLTFTAVYAPMLTVAVFVPSAALSACAGGVLFVGGIIAGNRHQLGRFFEPGFARGAFDAVTLVLPRISSIGTVSADLAASLPLRVQSLESLLGGTVLFALAALAMGVWRFEQRDF
jgi:Cu-processing system permease protein